MAALSANWSHDSVPMILELKAHQSLTQPYTDLLAKTLSAESQTSVTRDDVHDLLSLGIGVVVFDGLDEIPVIEQRRKTVSAIEAFSARFPRTRVIVTSREEGYIGAQMPSDEANFLAYVGTEAYKDLPAMAQIVRSQAQIIPPFNRDIAGQILHSLQSMRCGLIRRSGYARWPDGDAADAASSVLLLAVLCCGVEWGWDWRGLFRQFDLPGSTAIPVTDDLPDPGSDRSLAGPIIAELLVLKQFPMRWKWSFARWAKGQLDFGV